MSNNETQHITPLNELDLQMRTTETVWYSQDIDNNLQADLTKKRFVLGEKGEILRDFQGVPLVTTEDFSTKLKIQTRDNRLSNLDSTGYLETRWLDGFASDTHLLGSLPRSTVYCLLQKDSILNLSHSKKGWFRKMMNSIFQSHTVTDSDDKKKKLLKNI